MSSSARVDESLHWDLLVKSPAVALSALLSSPVSELSKRDKDYNTLLHIALTRPDLKLVVYALLLLDGGAKKVKNAKGEVPATVAAKLYGERGWSEAVLLDLDPSKGVNSLPADILESLKAESRGIKGEMRDLMLTRIRVMAKKSGAAAGGEKEGEGSGAGRGGRQPQPLSQTPQTQQLGTKVARGGRQPSKPAAEPASAPTVAAPEPAKPEPAKPEPAKPEPAPEPRPEPEEIESRSEPEELESRSEPEELEPAAPPPPPPPAGTETRRALDLAASMSYLIMTSMTEKARADTLETKVAELEAALQSERATVRKLEEFVAEMEVEYSKMRLDLLKREMALLKREAEHEFDDEIF
jgi:hypothetical protein